MATGLWLSAGTALANGDEDYQGDDSDDSGAVTVPELDAGGAGAALALIAGGAFLLADRRRRRSAG